MKLLVDSEEFWASLKADIASARDYVYLQTLSFEGDTVGKELCAQLKACAATDVRVIVDSYTKYIISDKFLYTPRNLCDTELRHEVKETHRMIDDIRQHGVGFKWVNPVGFLLHRFPSRNHKKMVVIDGHITYVGGINFSEHNFAWHDMMLRLDDTNIATVFAEDFKRTWLGENEKLTCKFDGIEFIFFDGKNNESLFEPIMDLLDGASKSVTIESPYLSFPFVEKLAELRKRGIDITIITPEDNNKKLVKQYILWEAARHNFKVELYQGRMTHLKAMLIDDETLIMGSTNFDYLSYTLQQEIAAIVTDRTIVDEFIARIIEPDLRNSKRFDGQVDAAAGARLNRRLRSVARLAVTLNRL
ncbi:MAG: phosphatidylserine/phosphatidylglycerophosphate/cardiolipin synthase family protein [candidate division Zixibacteria bacterium]|nr:phosphatidylserine/phosphatidylglycerophosphate/cardiolipin synthase family protein [candidate division Zixibacteria bacterium]